MRIVLTTLLLALTLTACGGEGGDDGTSSHPALEPETTEVTVRFIDASVPPEYHRSWTLTLDADRAHLQVDVYDEPIAEEEQPMPGEAWQEFVADLPAALDALGEPETVDDGCVGGTTTRLEIDSVQTENGGTENDGTENDGTEADRDGTENDNRTEADRDRTEGDGAGTENDNRTEADRDRTERLEIYDCGSDHNSQMSDDVQELLAPFTELLHLDEHTTASP